MAVFSGGAFFGAAFPPFLTKHIGRRRVLSLAGSLLLLGGILQVAAQAPSLAMIYAGRVLCGFGIGIISNLSPVYIAECAPKEYRGLMMGMFEMFLVSGGLLSYWTTYGTGRNLPASSEQWRVPLSLQVILAFMVTVGSFFVCESPRWLAKAGRYEDAERSLCYLRSSTPEDPMIQVELAEIKAQIQEEIAATEGRSWKELFIGANLRRLFWGLGVATCSIWCGHNAILYCKFSTQGNHAKHNMLTMPRRTQRVCRDWLLKSGRFSLRKRHDHRREILHDHSVPRSRSSDIWPTNPSDDWRLIDEHFCFCTWRDPGN